MSNYWRNVILTGILLFVSTWLSSTFHGMRVSSVRTPDSPDWAWEYYWSKRQVTDGGSQDLYDRYQKARRHLQKMPRHSTPGGTKEPLGKQPPALPALSAGDLSWEALGPGNIGGRTRALLIHPGDPEILYAGGVSGGVWKTVNGGDRWQPLTDFLPNIAVSSMAMDPASPDVLYAGTGEGHFREIVRGTGLPLRGGGIFKSEDEGASWRRLAATANSDFQWVNDLEVSVRDPKRIYAATRSGVWRSQDGGESWTRVLQVQVQGGCFDLAQRTDVGGDYLLVSCGTFAQAEIYLNPEAETATSWNRMFTEFGMGRTSLAIAPSDQDVVYALSASIVGGPSNRFNGGLHAVFRSDSGGRSGTWRATVRNSDPVKLNTLLLTNPVVASLLECGFGSRNSYSTLGWYTNMIAVDPTNPDVVWAGGIDLFRSDDGGRNWGLLSYWFDSPASAHADQHLIRFHPDYDGNGNQTLFLAGDGGVFRTDNALATAATGPNAPCSPDNTEVRWQDLNNNYGVTQFYHGAPFPDGRRYLGGTQDNGTVLGNDGQGPDDWRRVLGGDGGYVAVDPTNPQIVYAESQGLALAKSTDGGASFVPATRGIVEAPGSFLFIVPFQMDPNNSNRLWIGGRTLWRTNDGALSWQRASRQLADGRVSALAVSPVDSNRLLVGTDSGNLYRNNEALNANGLTTWPGVQPRSGFVTGVAFDPTDPQIAYATYGGFGGSHVWKSSDGGATWSSIDGAGMTSVPDIPVHAIVIDPEDRQKLYLATDLGLLVSTDGGLNWAAEEEGLPRAVTESITLLRPSGEEEAALFAFTHGRGAWRAVAAGTATPPSCSPERWIVHLTPPGVEFTTTLLATNLGQLPGALELVPFRGDGTQLEPVSLEVQPGETRSELSTALFGQEDVSHLGICGPSAISLSAAYRITSIVGASAHVPENSVVDSRFLVYPGERPIVFDGLALVNLGGEEAEVTSALLDASGAEIAQIQLAAALSPNGKYVDVLQTRFEGVEATAVRIESTQPAVVLLLRGTRPPGEPMLLYQTVPIALTPRQ